MTACPRHAACCGSALPLPSTWMPGRDQGMELLGTSLIPFQPQSLNPSSRELGLPGEACERSEL